MSFNYLTLSITFLILPVLLLVVPSLRKIYFLEGKIPGAKKSLPKKKRDLFFDVIKGISILAVILIHVQYVYFEYFFEALSQAESLFFIFISNLGRFAIPIFLVSSGALLSYKKNDTPLRFFRKRTTKILIPFFIVAFLLLIIQQVPPSKWFIEIITGKISTPFYFVIVLIQLYLLYPLLLKMIRYKWFLYFSFVFSLLIYAPYQLGLDIFKMGDFTGCFFGRFLFFFVFGMYTKEYYLSNPKKFTVPEIMFWSSTLFIFLLEVLLSKQILYNVRLLYGMGMLNIFFIFKNKFFGKVNIITTFLSKAGKLSLWIFLLHYQIEEFVLKLVVSVSTNAYLNFISTFIITTFLSFLLAKICATLYEKLTTTLTKKIKCSN